jgi:hypothetical protein
MATGLPLTRHIPLATDLPFIPQFHLDSMLAVTVFAIFVVATAVAGLAPAWQAYDACAPGAALTSRAGSTPRHSVRAHRALIIGEIAITVILLAGASVLLRSFDRLAHVDLGLTPIMC